MRHFRKQFDGQWKVISLSDKEIAEIETQTFNHLSRIQAELVKRSISYMSLPDFKSQYEAFASDFIEGKWKAFQAKKAAAEAASAS